jgi:hypothetical protein
MVMRIRLAVVVLNGNAKNKLPRQPGGRSRQVRVVQHDAGATRSNDLARRCDEMTTAFRFANASGQVHHGVFSKGGQSKSLSGSGLKLPHRATDFTKLDGGSPTPNVEGRGRGHWHRLAQLAQPRSVGAVAVTLIKSEPRFRAG